MNNLAPLIGRIMIAQIFLMSGFGKIFNFAGTQQYMAGYGMPLTALLLFGAIVFELAGGFSLLLGYKARWGAILLIVFLIPTTLIFHTALEDLYPGQPKYDNELYLDGCFKQRLTLAYPQ